MLQKRIYRLILSALITAVWMMILVAATSSEHPQRILTMLGGTMPEGLIQAFTYLFFVFAVTEIVALSQRIAHENDAFAARLLPEKDNWVLSIDDVNQLKLNMQQIEHSQKFMLTDLIKKACTKYRLSRESAEVLGLVDAQIRIYNAQIESEQSFVRYCSWAIPSVGFIGTVLGIAQSLGFANEADTPEGIAKVTSMLAVAFDTTLVALLLSIVLMFLVHVLQKRQDELFTRMNSYLIENLINRFYK